MRWRRKWQPTPVFLPGESQGQGSLVSCLSMGLHRVRHNWSNLAAVAAGFPGGASGKELPANAGDKKLGFDPWVGKIPWRRAWHSSILAWINPIDRGAWWATVPRVATLKWLSWHAHTVSPQGCCICFISCLNSFLFYLYSSFPYLLQVFFPQKSFHRTFLITLLRSVSLSSPSFPPSLLYFSIILNIIKYLIYLLAVFLCMNVSS